MGTITILPQTTKTPISLIGQMAGVCYGADTTDDAKNYKRGLDCIDSEHGRTLEFPDVYMSLNGYSARVIREWYTHIGCLPTRLQESTRYINYNEFDYILPPSIQSNDLAMTRYECTMEGIRTALLELEKLGIPREDCANLLPLGMRTRIVDKRNLRNLIDMSRNRLCSRAYWEFRGLFIAFISAIYDYSEEWRHLVEYGIFKPKCEITHVCPEKHGCGRYPTKSEINKRSDICERA